MINHDFKHLGKFVVLKKSNNLSDLRKLHLKSYNDHKKKNSWITFKYIKIYLWESKKYFEKSIFYTLYENFLK